MGDIWLMSKHLDSVERVQRARMQHSKDTLTHEESSPPPFFLSDVEGGRVRGRKKGEGGGRSDSVATRGALHVSLRVENTHTYTHTRSQTHPHEHTAKKKKRGENKRAPCSTTRHHAWLRCAHLTTTWR